MYKIGMTAALALILIMFLEGCSGGAQSIVSGSESEQAAGKRLAVRFLLADPQARTNSETIYDVISTVTPEVYSGFIESNLPGIVRKYAQFGEVVFARASLETSLRELGTGSEPSIHIQLPEEGTDTRSRNRNADYTLFLEGISITLSAGSSGEWYFPSSHEGIPSADARRSGAVDARLIHQGKFAIWDNLSGRVVVFGNIEDARNLKAQLSEAVFSEALDHIVAKIFKSTPFRRK